MKVLVSAYACEPGKGSEPEVGWQWVRQIARFNEAWVITRANNRENIERALLENPVGNLHFVYVDLPDWARLWKKGRRGVHLYYYLWQIIMRRKAQALCKEIKFDVAHHLTFINLYMGPQLVRLNLPFVWGPVGANPFIPLRYSTLIGLSGFRDNILRYMVRVSANLRDPFLKIAEKKAKRIIAINQEIRNRFSVYIQKKVVVIPQNALAPEIIVQSCRKRRTNGICIAMIGQMVPIKGHCLALKAFSQHFKTCPDSRFLLIGDGPLRKSLQLLVKSVGLSNAVTFLGQVSRVRVLELMANDIDVFLFPSFEGAGMVVLEAMANGVPVVCLDFGGPGEYVTEHCGIKIPTTAPQEVVHGLAGALNKLASDPVLYERLSKGALERVQENYTWDQIGDRLNSLYQGIIAEK